MRQFVEQISSMRKCIFLKFAEYYPKTLGIRSLIGNSTGIIYKNTAIDSKRVEL